MTPSHFRTNENVRDQNEIFHDSSNFGWKSVNSTENQLIFDSLSHKTFKMVLYRVSVDQELEPSECPKRVELCLWLLTNYAPNKAEFNNFFYSDKA